MLHRNRKGLGPTSGRRLLLGAAALVIILSSCRTAPEVPPSPESLPLPDDSALYLFLSPRERGDLAYRLLESFDIGAAMASRIEIAGIAVAREAAPEGTTAGGGTDAATRSPALGSPDSPGGAGVLGERGVVVAVRGDLPTRRVGRALRRSDEWQEEDDSLGRTYYRQTAGPWLLTIPGDGTLLLGNEAPEALPAAAPLVSPLPPDFLERFAAVPIAAYLPSPGGGALSTPLGGVLPLQELRFYVDDAEAEEGPDTAAAGWVNLSGEAVLDTERSARAFEAILRLLALGIAAEMEMQPGRVRELLKVSQRENYVLFSAGPLETEQLMALSSELLGGAGGGLFGGAP